MSESFFAAPGAFPADAPPLISVVVRTRDRPHLLSKALESLARQTYPAVEAVVVNDGGIAVGAIVGTFASRVGGGVQLVEHAQSRGRAAAANAGIRQARGEWLAFLDDDDVFEAEGLARLARIIPWDKDVIYGQVQVVHMAGDPRNNRDGWLFGESYDEHSLLLNNSVPICGYICKRERALALGGFDEAFEVLEDWDFFYRLTRGAGVHYEPELVARYCVWGEAYVTGKQRGREREFRTLFFRKHAADLAAEALTEASLAFAEKLHARLYQARLETAQKALELDALLDKHRELAEQHRELHENLAEKDQLLAEKGQLEAQVHALQAQAAALPKTEQRWRKRFGQVLKRVSLNMAFELPGPIIDLPAYGLSVPTKLFSAQSLSTFEVIPEYDGISFAMPVTQGKTLRWACNWQQAVRADVVLIKLGTYQRVNQCALELKLFPLDEEAPPYAARVHGQNVPDNLYTAFALDRPLPAGRYVCELHSPDADNLNHLLGVWLSTHHRRLGGARSDGGVQVFTYRYAAPQRADLEAELADLAYRPLISILLPTYNTPARFLRECLDSVVGQVYPEWELCIADDASNAPQVREILEEYRARFPERIKIVYRESNGHISAASNSALELAGGEFVALLDHDDMLTPDALLEIAKALNQDPDAPLDLLYSDEDKWDAQHECFDEPHFKPEWSPENLKAQMYIGHLGVYRRSLVTELGGFRLGLEGSQDWDLALRASEKARGIRHIPKVLYHWRKHEQSTAAHLDGKSYTFQAGLRAVRDALEREGEGGAAELTPPANRILVRYPVRGTPLVSIVIPTRDKADLLAACLESLIDKTTYPHWEVVVVDNGSEEDATFALFERMRERLGEARFKVCHDAGPFNFSRLVNQGAQAAAGELILLLNNDTEVLGPEHWLEEMIGYAQRPGIGCVGCKLLYADKTLQHAGIVGGIGGVAGHSHRFFPSHERGYYDRLTFVADYLGVTAACLMVRRGVWEEAGGFDEGLAVAFNDVDFCLKVTAQGHRNVVLPHVAFYHYESKSRGLVEDTPEKQRRFTQECRTVRERWDATLLQHDPYYSPHLSKVHEDFSMSEDSIYYCNADEEELFDWRAV